MPAAVPTVVAAPARPAGATDPATWSNEVSFFLNGAPVTVTNPDPAMHLVEYIREVEGLKATKIGCNEGGCGACTVVLSWHDDATCECTRIVRRLGRPLFTPPPSFAAVCFARSPNKVRTHQFVPAPAVFHGRLQRHHG